MSQPKAKIVFDNDTFVIVNSSVADVKTALADGGLVEFDISKKEYDYTLNTINIGEKQVPAYNVVTTTTVVNAALVTRVEETDEAVALAYTGAGNLPE